MSFLQVQNLSKTYHYDDYSVLLNVSFQVDKGEVATVLLGQNGGKTTLAKILVGIEELSDGVIFFDGVAIKDMPPQQREIAFVSVPSIFDKGKVKTNVLYGLKVRGVDKNTAWQIASKQLKEYDLQDQLCTKVSKLTLCQKLKLDFARAFCRKVSLVILDDCFGKDAEVDDFLQKHIPLLKAKGCAILNLCNDKKYAMGKIFDFLPVYLEEKHT